MSYVDKQRLADPEGADGISVIEDMLNKVIKQLKIMNLHLAIITDNEIKEEEVE